MYTHCSNGESFVFVIKVSSKIKDLINRSFVFIHKSKTDVDLLIQEYLELPERKRKNLIEVNEKVIMLRSNYKFEETTLMDIHNMHKEGNNLSIQKLSFEKFVNNKGLSLNFIPFVYQEMRTPEKTKMLIYDLKSNQIVEIIPINPS